MKPSPKEFLRQKPSPKAFLAQHTPSMMLGPLEVHGFTAPDALAREVDPIQAGLRIAQRESNQPAMAAAQSGMRPTAGGTAANIALSGVISPLLPRTAEAGVDMALRRFTDAGGDASANANLFGAASAVGAVGGNVGLGAALPAPGGITRGMGLRQIGTQLLRAGATEGAVQGALSGGGALLEGASPEEAAKIWLEQGATVGTLGAVFRGLHGAGSIGEAIARPRPTDVDLDVLSGRQEFIPPEGRTIVREVPRTTREPSEVAYRDFTPRTPPRSAFDILRERAQKSVPVLDEAGKIGVFHGSPHKFDRFSMEKIGTGEGAQAYGHGLYFTDTEALAKHYREKLSNAHARPTSYLATEAERVAHFKPGTRVLGYGGMDEVVAYRPGDPTARYPDNQWHVDVREVVPARNGQPEQLGYLRSHSTEPSHEALLASGARTPTTGALYRAEIDAEPEHFLDWDKPLSEQSDYVRQALAKEQDLYRRTDGESGAYLPEYATGEQIYHELAREYHGPREASATLRDMGIVGNRYLDRASRGKGVGSSNYVIFDDKPISILNREGAGAPRLLAGTAGGIGGAAYGATQGDTPEQRFKNAVAYGFGFAAAGMGAGYLAENRAAVWDRMKSAMRARGDLPQAVFDFKLARDARLSAAGREVAYRLRDFNRAASEVRGTFDLSDPTVASHVNDVLGGQAHLNTLPDALQGPTRTLRQHVDALSRRLVSEGIVQGDLAARIEGNQGVYLTRSYRAFDDPHWAEKVPEDVKNAAIAKVRSELADQGLAGAALDEQVDLTIQRLLVRDPQSPINVIASGKLGSKDLSSFIARKDIGPEIRALMGEYHDPKVNYVRSVAKMTQVLENDRLLREVREAGMGTFLHDKPRKIGGMFYDTPLAAEGSDRMAPLNGLYTTKAIAEAFRERLGPQGTPPAWLSAFYAANSAAKYGKTVLSVASTVRNFTGNIGFAVANGHWHVNAAADAFGAVRANLGAGDAIAQRIAETVGGRDVQAFRDYYTELVRRGVVDESTTAGELRGVLRDAHLEGPDWQSRLLSRGQSIADLPATVYGSADDVWKVYAFENEAARYTAAHPEWTPEQVKAKAAENVRRTYPTYSQVPPAVQALRRFPLVGTFVSFNSEVVRTSFNTLQLASEELRSANPALQRAGATRAAGVLAVLTLIPAAAATFRHLRGMTKDEENDVRLFTPPWSENNPLLFTHKDEGSYKYVDLGFSDPHAVLRRPVYALLRGQPPMDALKDALQETLSPYFGEDIVASRLADLARNTTAQGRPIYNTEAPWGEQAQAAYLHLWDAFEPGTITSGRRILRGLSGETSASGKHFDAAQETAALLTGTRQSTVNIPQAFAYRVQDYVRRDRLGGQMLSGVAGKVGEVSAETLGRAYHTAESARQANFDDLQRYLAAARRLQVSDERLAAVLRANGLSKDDVVAVMRGQRAPERPSPQFLKTREKRQVESSENADSLAEVYAQRRTQLDSIATAAGAPPTGRRNNPFAKAPR